ncbi:hypothetical protein [Fimbriimonas ginsengisoli]|uniref:Uncharacterized protein n=1 Tax=Fimbriimonas ginsengisoli Gsoil 348 TaxID=661478 RepID=A0A068NPI6_FIMGI|nr:hypothetical protein [Fimbriimonas ginsengisoli]AIE84645.1 hypothetical protein OP10G_1277 [Fimbriimonas ginsengisoli Gsoil 348]
MTLNPPPAPVSAEELREEMASILARYYLLLSSVRDKEHRRIVTLKRLAAFTATVFALGLLAIALGYGPGTYKALSRIYWPVPAFVIWAGLMGGAVSAMIRVANAPTKGDEDTLVIQFKQAMKSVYTAPLLGAVFAIVLYIGFCANVVNGTFFPNMLATSQAVYLPDVDGPRPPTSVDTATALYRPDASAASKSPSKPESAVGGTKENPTPSGPAQIRTEEGERRRTQQYVWAMMPASSRDFSLVLFWAFVAGFIERLVPDLLDRIIAKQKG